MTNSQARPEAPRGRRLVSLSLLAFGIVYGDIGTSPVHAIRFFSTNGVHAFLVLGAVFLATTGGEALYADLGHFGERPIQILGVHRLIVTKRPSGMAMWREKVFASMMRNATSASNFFGLPPDRVVELGAQMEL